MVMTVAGPPLTKFAGHAQPLAYNCRPRLERASNDSGERRDDWLVSPGVVDCAILTIVLGTTRPGGAVFGGHRPGAPKPLARGLSAPWRTSIHFSGPRMRRSRRCSIKCLAGQTATVEMTS